jgi:hypothetical protein
VDAWGTLAAAVGYLRISIKSVVRQHLTNSQRGTAETERVRPGWGRLEPMSRDLIQLQIFAAITCSSSGLLFSQYTGKPFGGVLAAGLGGFDYILPILMWHV